MQDQHIQDGQQEGQPPVASAQSAAVDSAVTVKSQASGSSHSSSSNRKRTGYTIPDPVSVEEHGRSFNGYREGKYLLPNDALEQERLDLAHEMWRLLLFGDLSWVPFADEPKQVLDIGTGTGIWAIEFAQQHPTSHVIGTDISLIQPPEGSIPSNCTFERDDVEEQWVFDRLFDYIHLRAMLTCFNDHLGLVQQIYDNLVPGGWVEYHDYDPEVFGMDEANQQALLTSPLWRWLQRVFKGAQRFGRDMLIARRYKKFLIDTGFVDVAEKIVLAPNKPWPEDPRERRIGQYQQANSLEMIDGVSAKLLQADGMTPDEIESLISQCRESFQSKELHLYSRIYVVYGRKPRDDELPPKAATSEATVKDKAAETQALPHEPVASEISPAMKDTPRESSLAMTDEDAAPIFDAIAQELEVEDAAIEPVSQSTTVQESDSVGQILAEPAPRSAQTANHATATGEAGNEFEVGLRQPVAPARHDEEMGLATTPHVDLTCQMTTGDGAEVEHLEFTSSATGSEILSNSGATRFEPRDGLEEKTTEASLQSVNEELPRGLEQSHRVAHVAQPAASLGPDDSNVHQPIPKDDFQRSHRVHLGEAGKDSHTEPPDTEGSQGQGTGRDASQPITMMVPSVIAQSQQIGRDYHEELRDLAGLQRRTESLDRDGTAATRSEMPERPVESTGVEENKTTSEDGGETSRAPETETRLEDDTRNGGQADQAMVMPTVP